MTCIALVKRLPVSFASRQRAHFTVLCFVWGTTWLAMKIGIAIVPPGLFAGTRWTTAGLMLLLWRWARGQRLQIPPGLLNSAQPSARHLITARVRHGSLPVG
jgi:drug/metabolite transporter (DMT)-like permease